MALSVIKIREGGFTQGMSQEVFRGHHYQGFPEVSVDLGRGEQLGVSGGIVHALEGNDVQ